MAACSLEDYWGGEAEGLWQPVTVFRRPIRTFLWDAESDGSTGPARSPSGCLRPLVAAGLVTGGDGLALVKMEDRK